MTSKAPNFKALDTGVSRVAALPSSVLRELSACDESALDAYLQGKFDDPVIAEGIYLASPGLYRRLARWRAGDAAFADAKFAFARYLRRMAFRATPFGTFASVGTFRLGAPATQFTMPARSAMRRRLRLDGALTMGLLEGVLADSAGSAEISWTCNDTIVRNAQSVRFLAYDRSPSGKRIYKMVEVEASAELEHVLMLARDGARIDSLVRGLVAFCDGQAGADEAEEYVRSLIASQLLCADQFVALSSEHLLAHVAASMTVAESPAARRVLQIQRDFETLSNTALFDADHFEDFAQRHFKQAALRQKPIIQADLHHDAHALGAVSAKLTQALEKAISFSAALSSEVPWHLAAFAQRFEERYSDGEVALLDVLDERNGLWTITNREPEPALVRQVFGRGAARSDRDVLTQRLCDALTQGRQGTGHHYVPIEHLEASGGPFEHASTHSTAPFAVAWCSLWQSGGADGNERVVPEVRSVTLQDPGRVLGRFSHGDARVVGLLDDVARLAHGGDVLHAEIVHLPEDRLVNLASRASQAEFEITIRTAVSAGAERIPLADITVSISNRRVILRSASRGKQIVPHMSNAHKFSAKSNLSIYRFLNLIATQYVGVVTFSPRDLFPHVRYLSGITCGDAIIARPTWKLFGADLSKLRALDARGRRNLVQAWRVEFGLPRWIALTEEENAFPIDLDCRWMVDEFVRKVSRQHSAVLSDAAPFDLEPALASVAGAHHHELLVVLKNTAHVPPKRSRTGFVSAPALHHAPGSEWLYFKIHTAPSTQDQVLAGFMPAVEMLARDADFRGHFFIRYHDEAGPHLRWRLHGSAALLRGPAYAHLLEFLESCRAANTISEFSIHSYKPEVARYGGPQALPWCERIFFADTQACLELLQQCPSLAALPWQALVTAIDDLLRALGVQTLEQRLSFAARAAADFAREMGFGSEQRKQIGNIHRLAKQHSALHATAVRETFQRKNASIAACWLHVHDAVREHLDADAIYHLRWSIVHMRMNRLLSHQARKQEAILWDLLRRGYERERALQADAAPVFG